MKLLNEIKYFIQRGIRGFSDRDCWNIDYYLTEILPKMLDRLNKLGCPIAVWSDKSLNRWTETDPNNLPKVGAVKWGMRLRRIKEMFYLERLRAEYGSLTSYQEKRRKHGWKLFQYHFLNLWD